MRYRMKQKLFSIGDDFHISDDNGRKVATIDGKVFSIGNKLVFLDEAGREIAMIKQKLLALRPVYEITREGKLVASVKKDFFSLLRCAFTVDVPGPGDLAAQGSFLEHEYTFTRGDKTVATVSKAWFSLTDSYGVDVAAGEDDILLLASTVVIDMCCHEQANERS